MPEITNFSEIKQRLEARSQESLLGEEQEMRVEISVLLAIVREMEALREHSAMYEAALQHIAENFLSSNGLRFAQMVLGGKSFEDAVALSTDKDYLG